MKQLELTLKLKKGGGGPNDHASYLDENTRLYNVVQQIAKTENV